MSRGGKREGAGRPAPDGNRTMLNARVAPRTMEGLRKMAETEGSIGKAIDKLVQERQ